MRGIFRSHVSASQPRSSAEWQSSPKTTLGASFYYNTPAFPPSILVGFRNVKFNSHLITNHAIVRDCIRSVADFCSDHSGKRADGGGQEQAKEGNQIVRAKSVFTGRSVLPSQFLCLGMWIRGGSTCCWAGPLRDGWHAASNSNTIKAHSEDRSCTPRLASQAQEDNCFF